MSAAAASRVFIIYSRDSAKHSGPAGSPDWLKNRPALVSPSLFRLFYQVEIRHHQAFKSQSHTADESRRPTRVQYECGNYVIRITVMQKWRLMGLKKITVGYALCKIAGHPVTAENRQGFSWSCGKTLTAGH